MKPTRTKCLAYWLVALSCSSLGCKEGYLGTECRADSSTCGEREDELPLEYIDTNFRELSPPVAAPLQVVARFDNPCLGSCEEMPAMLAPASGDAVWSLPRTSDSPTLELIHREGVRLEQAVAPPAQSASVRRFITSTSDGAAVGRFQWDVLRSGVRAPGPDEIVMLAVTGTMTRVQLEAGSGLRAPLGVLVVPAGFLLFPALGGEPLRVQLVSREGRRIWALGTPPMSASAAGGAAVHLVNGGFMLSAHHVNSAEPSLGLLQLAADGTVQRYATPKHSIWRDVRLLQVAHDAYALAARSDLVRVGPGDGTGNLEIARFADDGTARGLRLMRECYHAMELHGFAADSAGNLFVSTVGGERLERRGLLCRWSVTDELRCFEAAPGVLLREIVATSATTLFAVAGDEILRIELPE